MKKSLLTILAKTLVLISICCSYANAAPTFQVISELNFRSFLPVPGSCEMDYDTRVVSDLLGSIMCMGNQTGIRGLYRITGDANTDFEIIIRSRQPQNGDGFTYTPAGRIVSTVDNILIVQDTIMTVNTGNGGYIDIYLAGQVTVNNVFTPDSDQTIEMDGVITWGLK